MENSTKALIIAAGVLFAIMILSLLAFSYNRLTSTQQTKQSSMSEEQLTAFNKEYEAYNRDDVTGFELVSLINKIIDFNAHNAVDDNLGFKNTDRAYEKMYISFKLTDSSKFGTLFKVNKEYDSEAAVTNTEIEKIMNNMQKLENKYGSSNLSSLVSLGDEYKQNDPDEMNRLLNRNGSNKIKNFPQEIEVKQYGEYIEFKRAKFTCKKEDGTNGVEYDKKTGRVVKLYFQPK